ncbi:GntR family transcriptional regulator [Streptomyces sp. NEAU-Y11]|uniref:GntR family transcriptional regulator n=1 Tax=Streptomyces cucumeris TaxID=2962890 RepID=UPI0020C8EEF9|nr:GntR family transcriptional regulator [Streptomyces sp. NEAU-Y11]MCP9213127.1 GntR family transcriptional regulator [Streptomyces sp. NEAU-Y11]
MPESDHAAPQILDRRQLRDDLLVLWSVNGTRMQATPASEARNLDMLRRIARHWAPFGHIRRAAADGFASEEQRWDILLACAEPERSVEESYAAVVVYACAVRELVQALDDATRASVPDVARAITTILAGGAYPVGWCLRLRDVAADVTAPVATVKLAVNALVDRGVLERRGQRIFPAGSREVHDALAPRIADRIRAQIAAGIYAPGSRLPRAGFLARAFCSDFALIRRAVRILATEGLVRVSPRCTEVLESARVLAGRGEIRQDHGERAPHLHRDIIVATCRTAYEQWRHRSPVPEEVLHGRWQDLRSIAGQLLAAVPPPAPDATQDLAALGRAADLASAPLPDKPWLQQWHTACLATAISSILPLVPKETQ